MVKIAYVDSSVWIKHYVESEKASASASQLLTDYKVFASVITQVEMFSALARKFQLQEISIEDVKKIKDAFRSDCQRAGMIEVSDDVVKEAQNLVFRTTIKTLDAIHLASYILLKRETEVSFPLITADNKLASAANKESFEVIGVGI
ncbi:MAG TPA: type II toxin-antitoxin system VapC family toxin [Candidatus Wunengus sp. YC60]|uniref:type II toxin-antitoxin system VapC family toxin n=1 Tax=Candidatus Wunengus sp. YC60 TaxID=3367697 RepID=UPI00402521BD